MQEQAIYVFNITSKVQRDGGKDDRILRNGEDTTRKENGVSDPRPKLQEFYIPGQISLYAKQRGMMKVEKGDVLHGSGHAVGNGRVNTQLTFRIQT
jgi:hypothetical protein